MPIKGSNRCDAVMESVEDCGRSGVERESVQRKGAAVEMRSAVNIIPAEKRRGSTSSCPANLDMPS